MSSSVVTFTVADGLITLGAPASFLATARKVCGPVSDPAGTTNRTVPEASWVLVALACHRFPLRRCSTTWRPGRSGEKSATASKDEPAATDAGRTRVALCATVVRTTSGVWTAGRTVPSRRTSAAWTRYDTVAPTAPGIVTSNSTEPSAAVRPEPTCVQAPVPVRRSSVTGRGRAGGNDPVSSTCSLTVGGSGVAVNVPATGAADAATGTSWSPPTTTTSATSTRQPVQAVPDGRRVTGHSFVAVPAQRRVPGR